MHSRGAQEQMPLDPFTIIASGAFTCVRVSESPELNWPRSLLPGAFPLRAGFLPK